MGEVSCGLRGLHSGLAWGILEGRTEISSWEVVKMLGSGLGAFSWAAFLDDLTDRDAVCRSGTAVADIYRALASTHED